jgi:hypothetical protein
MVTSKTVFAVLLLFALVLGAILSDTVWKSILCRQAVESIIAAL